MNHWRYPELLALSCGTCQARSMEFAHYFDKFHVLHIAARLEALTEHRYTDYAKQVAPKIASQIKSHVRTDNG